MKVLMIDNYDSFVYTLVGYIKRLGHDVHVVRNDAITLDEVELLDVGAIVISPGPGDPSTAGITRELIRFYYKKIPILGVCLGHQAIGDVFGYQVGRSSYPLHGEASLVFHEGEGVFKGIPSPCSVGRYHSLIVHEGEREGGELSILARTKEGEIMAFSHKDYPVVGVQFHPESLLTPEGLLMLQNFFDYVALPYQTLSNT